VRDYVCVYVCACACACVCVQLGYKATNALTKETVCVYYQYLTISSFLFWSYKKTKYKEHFQKLPIISRFEKNTNNIQKDRF